MATLTFTLDPNDDLDAALARLGQALQSMRPVFQDFGEHLYRETQTRFDLQRDPEGNPWADLKPATWRRKRNRRILTETTRLRGSIFYEADDQGAELSTPVKYAAIHQFGGTIDVPPSQGFVYYKLGRDGRPGNRFVRKSQSDFAQPVQRPGYQIEIDPRPFLGVNDGDLDYFVDLVGDHLEAAWNGG